MDELTVTVSTGRWAPTWAGVKAFAQVWWSAAPWMGCLRRPWLVPVAIWRTSRILGFKQTGKKAS